MPDVQEDLVNGHQLQEARGYTQIQRIYRVTGLDVFDPQTQLIEAVNDPDIPEIGDTYPGSSGGFPKYDRLIVTARQAYPDGCNAARVLVNYTNEPTSVYDQEISAAQAAAGTPTQDVKQITIGLVQETTTKDALDVDMNLPTPPTLTPKDYLATAQVGRPLGTLVFERTETIPVVTVLRDAVGRINSTILGSYAAGTLKLDRLDSISSDNGTTWRTSYQFSYKPDGWVFRDRWRWDSGKVPTDSVEQTFALWLTYDFSVLGLDFTDGQVPV